MRVLKNNRVTPCTVAPTDQASPTHPTLSPSRTSSTTGPVVALVCFLPRHSGPFSSYPDRVTDPIEEIRNFQRTRTDEHFNPDEWLRDFQQQAHDMAARAEQAQDALANNVATVENRLIRVTMAAGGTIQHLEFLPAATQASATELTTAFRELHSAAGAQVTRSTLAVMADLAGPDDPSLAAIRQAIPAHVQEAMDAEDEEAGR